MPDKKLTRLFGILKGFCSRSPVVAFSGGVDSTFLLKALKAAGVKKILAVTGRSESTPPWDLEDALRMAAAIGVPHRVIRTNELQNPAYAANSARRCFHCKDTLFARLKAIARKEGYACVLDGTNSDDALFDDRPGLEAARLHGVRSPLVEAGFTKKDVRRHSKSLGLPTWDKPSSPCLASRVPHGMPVTEGALKMVLRAETSLRKLGFREFRVRHHGGPARLEIARAEFEKAFALKDRIVRELKKAGFSSVTLDLEARGRLPGLSKRAIGQKNEEG